MANPDNQYNSGKVDILASLRKVTPDLKTGIHSYAEWTKTYCATTQFLMAKAEDIVRSYSRQRTR